MLDSRIKKALFALGKYMASKNRKSMAMDEDKWITLKGRGKGGGKHIMIDDETGEIKKGPSFLTGTNVTNVKSTFREKAPERKVNKSSVTTYGTGSAAFSGETNFSLSGKNSACRSGGLRFDSKMNLIRKKSFVDDNPDGVVFKYGRDATKFRSTSSGGELIIKSKGMRDGKIIPMQMAENLNPNNYVLRGVADYANNPSGSDYTQFAILQEKNGNNIIAVPFARQSLGFLPTNFDKDNKIRDNFGLMNAELYKEFKKLPRRGSLT